MTAPQQSCCGGRAASVAAAQNSQRSAPAKVEKFKIRFDDGTSSAATWPDERSAQIALARSPKRGKVQKV
jgi:hypothetical protein